MAYKVFISYSTKDISVVDYLSKILKDMSIEAFVAADSVGPGRPLSESINTAIKGCDLFLLLWSSNSKTSEWVPQEIGIAKSSGKLILPVILEPGLELPGFIKDLKYLETYKDPHVAIAYLRDYVLSLAQEKGKRDSLVLLSIFGALLWLFTKKE